MKLVHFLIILLLALPLSTRASYSVGTADVGFPGENKPFICRIQVLHLSNGDEKTKKKVYDITLTVPNEMRGKALNIVQLLSADGDPEDFEISLKVSEINKTQSFVNVRISESFSKNFVIRARYSDLGLPYIDSKTRISSDEYGCDISVRDQIDKFNKQK